MSDTKESDRLRAEVDALREQIAEATIRRQIEEAAGAEGIAVASLTSERDRLKAELDALNAASAAAAARVAPAAPAPKPAPAPVAETTDSPSGR